MKEIDAARVPAAATARKMAMPKKLWPNAAGQSPLAKARAARVIPQPGQCQPVAAWTRQGSGKGTAGPAKSKIQAAPANNAAMGKTSRGRTSFPVEGTE